MDGDVKVWSGMGYVDISISIDWTGFGYNIYH
jgi:hypothetical protein